MSQFSFALAQAADDGQLRRRMAEDWITGRLSVSFRREPSYFDGCKVQGESAQIIKCIEVASGKIIGMGSRMVSMAHINGTPQRLGYLADLRADLAYRGYTLLARGYRFLRQLHDADPVSLYYSLIFEGNTAALGSLIGARAGLPVYRHCGKILTPAVHLDLPKPAIKIPGVKFVRARREQMSDIFRFIRRWQSHKQFAPVYRPCDINSPRLRGLKAEDFFLGIRENRIVATVAAWDQSTFRQTHIEEYSAILKRVRPMYNALAALTPLKALPTPGDAIPYFYLSFVATEENDPHLFRGLLRHLYRELRSGPWHYFIAGLHEDDPLAQVLSEYRRIKAAGELFVIHYPEDELGFRRLDQRIPYVEIATI